MVWGQEKRISTLFGLARNERLAAKLKSERVPGFDALLIYVNAYCRIGRERPGLQ
jgi:hypothetical protein